MTNAYWSDGITLLYSLNAWEARARYWDGPAAEGQRRPRGSLVASFPVAKMSEHPAVLTATIDDLRAKMEAFGATWEAIRSDDWDLFPAKTPHIYVPTSYAFAEETYRFPDNWRELVEQQAARLGWTTHIT